MVIVLLGLTKAIMEDMLNYAFDLTLACHKPSNINFQECCATQQALFNAASCSWL